MSYVYVIKCSDTGLCKIGRSKNVELRVKHIESSSGFNCEVAYTSESLINAPQVEALAHEMCSGRRVGEWFSCATNHAISCVKASCSKVGRFGDVEFNKLGSYDLEFLSFWSVSGSFIKEHPLAVIKYALDTFELSFTDEVLSVCNRAYEIGSGGGVGDFADRLDVEIFFNMMIKKIN